MKIKILYEDSNLLAIDKPSGIAVHSDGRSNDPSTLLRTGKTIADWVLKNYPKMKNVGEPMRIENPRVKSFKVYKVKSESNFQLSTFNFITIPRPGIVHRLDKETSGVLLLAKNQKAYEFFKSQFQNREIKKTYHAIVSGSVKNDHDTINKPIGRSPKDFRRYLAGRGARGEMREAITSYKVLKRFKTQPAHFSGVSQAGEPRGSARPAGRDSDPKEGLAGSKLLPFTYLEIHPKTGRTHQIRVHMKFINHPVVCDALYNPDAPYPKGIKRLALHAKSIEFKNLKGKTVKVESPLPAEFEKACPALNF